MDKLREAVSAVPLSNRDGEALPPVTVSIGVAELAEDSDDSSELLKRADLACTAPSGGTQPGGDGGGEPAGGACAAGAGLAPRPKRTTARSRCRWRCRCWFGLERALALAPA